MEGRSRDLSPASTEEAVATMRRAPLEGGQMLMYWAMAEAQTRAPRGGP